MSSSSNTRSISKRSAAPLLLGIFLKPVAAADLNPLLSGFDVPEDVPSVAPHSIALRHSVGNISLDQTAGNEYVVLDAEVRRTELTYVCELTPTVALELSLPWINIDGGVLDAFIEGWHRSFNLPNGNRASSPRDRILVTHQMNGQTDLVTSTPSAGVGDLALRAGWRFNTINRHAASMWLSLKLPSGDANRLTGSGTTDVSLTLSASQQLHPRIETYELISATYLSNGPRLPEQQKNHIFSGTAGALWSLSSSWQFDARLSAHSALYDSTLRALGNSMQLHFGPVYIDGRWRISFSLSEDIAVDTAPDVQFTLGVARKL